MGFLLLAAGCGAGRGELKGKVTYQGKTVTSGSVLVLGQDGVPRSGLIREDGSYSVPDVRVGAVKIAVTRPEPAASSARPGKYGTRKPPPADPHWFPLPARYAEFETSGVTFTVEKGANEFDVVLD
jgi:hypothetical protein